jgi:DNA-binding Lrp family transcriptional regulator
VRIKKIEKDDIIKHYTPVIEKYKKEFPNLEHWISDYVVGKEVV